jgi:DNA-binding PadR family transcriptional regulator
MAKRDAERPLTPAVLHILLVLADGERHGYALMQEVPELSGGRVKLGPGTLYRTLQELLGLGWIEESAADPADARRRTYRLSRRGRQTLQSEMTRLDALVAAARARRVLGPEGAR